MNITLNPSSVADYATFLRVKSLPVYRIQGRECWFPDEYASRLGIDPVEADDVAPRLHKELFDYQRDIAKLAIQKKRFAVFADCGLGKTLVMLEFARHVRRVLPKKRILIISPLMVIEQTIAEHERWYGTSHKLEQVASSDLGKWTQGKGGAIGITNYEALRGGASFCALLRFQPRRRAAEKLSRINRCRFLGLDGTPESGQSTRAYQFFRRRRAEYWSTLFA